MIYLFILASLTVVLLVLLKPQRRKRKLRLKKIRIPLLLDYQLDEAKPLIEKLENSLPPSYMEKVKERVLTHHPHWTDHDFEWRLFELKRYFILSKIVKSVPMFSDEVDEIWHEMLMFTKEYEAFSKKFYGSFLHHTPTAEVKPIPFERAFFDWMYLQLFQPSSNSRLLWGSFLKHPLKKELLEEFISQSPSSLIQRYFRKDDEAASIQYQIIERLKADLKQAESWYRSRERNFADRSSATEDHTHLLTAMVFFSLYMPESYSEEMDELISEEENANGGVSGSSGSGFSCSSDNDSSCSSAGCSSSSCGGGCGSS
ncbi:glycine-rich domain-containing protein [Bacillus xiapuensis]|uniref:hypothetical protein n=1 Tax=Bacillus xiapuensis TaxID=2014075 RepID=UPI000C246967|nr:hypothetical protein [Bacillus xiapuensis]